MERRHSGGASGSGGSTPEAALYESPRATYRIAETEAWDAGAPTSTQARAARTHAMRRRTASPWSGDAALPRTTADDGSGYGAQRMRWAAAAARVPRAFAARWSSAGARRLPLRSRSHANKPP